MKKPGLAHLTILLTTLTYTAAADAEVSASAALATNAFFHGVTVTDDKPALLGRVDYAHDSGLYAGADGNNIDDNGDVAVEVNLFAGYRGTFDVFTFDAGVISYNYSPETLDTVNELYVGAGYGMVGLAFATNENGNYLQGNVKGNIKQVALAVHLGNSIPDSGDAYMDFGVAATMGIRGFDVKAELVNSDAPVNGGVKIAAGVSKAFSF